MNEISSFPEGYIGSTKAEIDHQMSNAVQPVRLALDGTWKPKDFPGLVTESQQRFITGLTRAVEESFPVFGGVTHQDVQSVINLANTIDWTNPDQLKKLVDLAGELRHKSEG